MPRLPLWLIGPCCLHLDNKTGIIIQLSLTFDVKIVSTCLGNRDLPVWFFILNQLSQLQCELSFLLHRRQLQTGHCRLSAKIIFANITGGAFRYPPKARNVTYYTHPRSMTSERIISTLWLWFQPQTTDFNGYQKDLPCCRNCDLTLNFSCFTKRVHSCSQIMFYKMLLDR